MNRLAAILLFVFSAACGDEHKGSLWFCAKDMIKDEVQCASNYKQGFSEVHGTITSREFTTEKETGQMNLRIETDKGGDFLIRLSSSISEQDFSLKDIDVNEGDEVSAKIRHGMGFVPGSSALWIEDDKGLIAVLDSEQHHFEKRYEKADMTFRMGNVRHLAPRMNCGVYYKKNVNFSWGDQEHTLEPQTLTDFQKGEADYTMFLGYAGDHMTMNCEDAGTTGDAASWTLVRKK